MTHRTRSARAVRFGLVAVYWSFAALSGLADEPPTIRSPASDSQVDQAETIVRVANPEIDESSGLAFSNRNPNRLWTHNDSGDTARLFAVDRQGNVTGGCTLAGVTAIDFEDMASFVQDSVARLVVADVGDNRAVRPVVSLYFFDEPPPDQQTSITNWTQIQFRYADGPRDCEAIAVDPQRGVVTLVTKSFLPSASIYEMPLPARGATDDGNVKTLTRVGHLTIPLVTALDRDVATGDYWLTNYFQIFRFSAADPAKPWWQSTPRASDLPRLKQIEAVAVDRSGDVWVTSEGSPMPLVKLKRPRP